MVGIVEKISKYIREPGDVLYELENYPGALTITSNPFIASLVQARPIWAHKGTFGHALVIAGSPGMYGAAMLTAEAAIRTGCGLVTAFVPEECVAPLLVRVPEIMTVSREIRAIQDLDLSAYKSIGIGPGFGTSESSSHVLGYLLTHYKGPLVIDADGLTLLAKNQVWYNALGKHIILTPHPGEFDRLTHAHPGESERLLSQLSFTEEYGATVVLKGHNTVTSGINGINFNTTGNDGMATAGSGDVLTGIITSLCAQGYENYIASVLGVFLHGYAGDEAAKKGSNHTLLASDIIKCLQVFFKNFEKEKF